MTAMTTKRNISQLQDCARSFGPEAAAGKLASLRAVLESAKLGVGDLRRLHDAAYFLLAYPDNAEVLQAARQVCAAMRDWAKRAGKKKRQDAGILPESGIPGTCNSYSYSYATVRRLTRLSPGSLEINWRALDDESALLDVLSLVVADAELQGLEDQDISMRDWVNRCKQPEETGLEFILRLFEQSSLGAGERVYVFESCHLPMIYALRNPGDGCCEAQAPSRAVHFQQAPVVKETFSLPPELRKPPLAVTRFSAHESEPWLDLATRALACRNLEIYPLLNANPADVALVHGDRGIDVLLAGVLPDCRNMLESLYFYLVLKNGVPIAYGPASVFGGCCEMGMNLFPEFRGGEVRYFYAQFMRALYHEAHARYFFLTSYGMGEGNPEAIASGAFWFYRKMGFVATNPEVEALARAEEIKLRDDRTYRCSRPTLHALSHTQAVLDLSDGECQPWHYGKLSLAASEWIVTHGGQRAAAERRCEREQAQALGIHGYARWTKDERAALRRLAPLLARIDDLPRWPAKDKAALAAIIRAKGGRSEGDFLRLAMRHARWLRSLRAIQQTVAWD